MATMNDWSEQEEVYLSELVKISQYLSQRYNITFLEYKRRQTRTRIPQILLSSISGLFSFGNSTFPPDYSGAVNIACGVSSLVVALIGAIESFLKIPEIMAGALQASINFIKLAEAITVELALHRHKRSSSGIVFLREAYKTYEKHTEAAPNVFKTVRFVRPFPYDKHTGMYQSSTIDVDESRSEEPTPSTTYNGRSMDLTRYTSTSPEDTPNGDSMVYVPTDGYALRAPRPPAAIDLPV